VAVPAHANLPPGWTQEKPILFKAENLYGHIDGGAELFLEFGFELLRVEYVRKGTREFTLEQYQMASPEAALGIYLSSAGKETPLKGIAARHTGSAYQITALKGRTFLLLINPKGGEDALPDMVACTNAALADLPEGRPADLFARLPVEGRVSGSEYLIRGQFGLQPVFTFGEGDILGMEGKLFASGAEYRDARNASFSRLVIDYSDEATARVAHLRLQDGLDPFLKKRWAKENAFAFQDFQGKFGRVERTQARLTITFLLTEEPKP
jgi:hypothetical protein